MIVRTSWIEFVQFFCTIFARNLTARAITRAVHGAFEGAKIVILLSLGSRVLEVTEKQVRVICRNLLGVAGSTAARCSLFFRTEN